MAAITRSIAKGSDQVVAALLAPGVDRFLSEGILSDLELETVRRQWALARHPDEVSLLAKRQSDLAHLERGASIMRSWQTKTHNPAIAAALPIGSIQQRGAPGPAPADRSRFRPTPIYGRG